MIPVELPALPPPDTNLEHRVILAGLELADDAFLVTPFGQVLVQGIDVDGWSGGTDSTGSDEQRVYGPGAVPSQNPQATPRVLTLAMTLIAESPAAMRWMWDELNTRASRTDFPFVRDEWGLRRTVTARRQTRPDEGRMAAVVKTWSCQLRCADPRKYGDLVTVTTGLPFTAGGLRFPLPFPARSNATSGTGVATFDNAGNADSPVLARITAVAEPLRAPKITHVGAYGPETWSYAGTVPAGNWLDVDFERRQVLENGTADRGQLVVSRGWFAAQGRHDGFDGRNTFAFQADVYAPTALCDITTAPSWE